MIGEDEQSLLELHRQGRHPADLQLASCHWELKLVREELRQLTEHFERRVAERTAELESARLEAIAHGEALRQSENRFQDVAEAMREYIWEIDLNCCFTFVSKQFESVMGYPPSMVLGRPVFNFLLKEDAEALGHVLNQALSNQRGFWDVTVRSRRPDGQLVWKRISGVPRRDGEGRLVGFRGASLDITELRRAEQKLESQYSLLTVLLKNLQAGVLVENENREILIVNQAFYDLFQVPVSPKDMVGLNCSDAADAHKFLFARPEDFVRRLKEVLDQRAVVTGEECLLADGRVLARDYVPILVEDDYRGHLWVYRDISREKAQEAVLLQAKEDAEAGTRAKSLFLASMSHEIRTPLNGIIGMTRMLLESGLNPKQRQCADAVKTSADGLLAILNDILDYSKVEAGKLELEIVPFSLPVLVNSIAEMIGFKARGKGLAFVTSIDPNLPPGLLGDSSRLRQVLLNLCDNAVKFTESGSVTLAIELRADSRVAFAVTDTGKGIPPERQARLFQSFDQLDPSIHRTHGGTGLGLAISQGLIRLMGGDIACRSTEGRGSTFTFHLELPEADLPASTGYQRSGPHEAPLKGLRILVAEDNVINQQVTLSVLGGFGAQAEVAGNGLEALEALQRFEYDLVLMDDRMPEMDGLTAVGRIRAMGNPIPIIAVTAHAMKGDRERYLVEGMNGYVTKPVEPDALLHEIERVLSARQQPAPVGPVTPVVSRPVTFDVERFRRLFSNKEDLCRSIGIEFISQTKEKFAKAMTALESEDRQAVADIFHNIAGSAGNLGAQRLGRLCRDLETQSEAGEDFAALAAAAFEALQEYRKVEHLLTRTLQLQEA